MSGSHGAPPSADDLRARAEEALRVREARSGAGTLSHADAVRLVHELQVHEIELEMQNDELVRVRAELEASLARYAELFDFAPVGYITLGRDGVIRDANAAAARIASVDRADLVTRRLESLVAGPDRDELEAAIARAWRSTETESAEVTLSSASAKGGERRVQISASSSADRESLRVVLVDVTDRRRAEEQLRAWLQMEAVGRLAGGVAHDFNNLLTIILSYASLALGAVDEDGPAHEHLIDIRDAAESAVQLTSQLLAFGRRQVLRPECVDINDLIRGLERMLRRLVGEDVAIALELGADAGSIEVDPAQMAQVLMNLAVNAREAMPRGGTLTVTTSAVEATDSGAHAASLSRAGPMVNVRVTDTGAGMDEATLARVFEPFFSTKDRERGTGFGLSTVYGIVHQCGGSVSAQSALGRGTTFEVQLPRAASRPSEAPVEATRTASSPPGKATILVVDDEPALRGAVKRILESGGYGVLVAESGARALEICAERAGAIALVLSDVVMPNMSGVVLAELLAERYPDTKVVLMSGYAEDVIERHGALGAATFLSKPFAAEVLLQTVGDRLEATSPHGAPAPG